MKDDEFIKKIEELTENFEGQINEFYEVVGMVMVGRLVGWRVLRLVSSRRSWTMANKLFGDLKDFLPERGKYAYKSVGLKISDKIGEYWEVVQGHKSIPKQDLKLME